MEKETASMRAHFESSELRSAQQAATLEAEFAVYNANIGHPLGLFDSLRIKPHYKRKATGIDNFIEMYEDYRK
jgi:hypothetical protein